MKKQVTMKWDIKSYQYYVLNSQGLLTFWVPKILLETTEVLGTQKPHICCTNSSAHRSPPTTHLKVNFVNIMSSELIELSTTKVNKKP